MNHAPPFRVLHVITRLIVGGAQEATMLTAQLLDKSIWDVHIVSGSQTGPEGSYVDEVRRRGIPLCILPELVREINVRKDLIAFWKLYRLIKDGNYDIVHTHSSKAGILARWAARKAAVPIILHSVHGWGHHHYQHPMVRRYYLMLERAAARISHRLIAVSTPVIDKGQADRIASLEKFTLIRSGIELGRFSRRQQPADELRRQLGIPEKASVIGTVTRLSKQKAPLDFVAAAKHIHRDMPDTHFVIGGDGPLRKEVEKAIADSGIRQRFHLTGIRHDVPEIISSFDIFVLTSLWEGLPRVIPQAMAVGCPVVATAVDGNPEIVRDGETGILVPPSSPEHIARAVLYLINNPPEAHRLSCNASKLVDEFSVDKMVEEHDRLYQTLIFQKYKMKA
jgi:glycosyltransferase involved in cell wall biosynthesis